MTKGICALVFGVAWAATLVLGVATGEYAPFVIMSGAIMSIYGFATMPRRRPHADVVKSIERLQAENAAIDRQIEKLESPEADRARTLQVGDRLEDGSRIVHVRGGSFLTDRSGSFSYNFSRRFLAGSGLEVRELARKRELARRLLELERAREIIERMQP